MNKKHSTFPIVLSIIILLSGASTIYAMNHKWSNQTIDIKNTLATQVTEQQETLDLKSIIHEAQKNVVQIEATTKSSNDNLGSGFIYNEKGDIITNAHVVQDASSIYVKTANARTYTAALVGIGENEDIAVIRVPQLANQSPAVVDEDYNAELGDEIIAVGSPLGFQNSVTIGIISGTDRSFSIDDYDYNNVYQISANITNGNSGGPLINRETGKIVGINSAGINEEGIGFSIPIHTVLDNVRIWSEQADNKTLNYDSLMNTAQSDNPEQLKEDATYIVSYFFDNLSIRDYITAYTLLGSDWQTKTNYQSFREDYVHMMENEPSDMQTTYLEEEKRVQVTIQTDSLMKESSQKTRRNVYEYTFYVGIENGQLKMLDGNRSLVDSEPLEENSSDG
ncbi:S1C family serine protease [Aquibacillus sediminis]|uniref:S1C family serine protease n=1 Tax=Aquibacillus sediminis TaxID=2574734 RepID=UPI001108F607|nr:trypsin-like peptidase domain-containing protein [Aquibacillus sediminis]